MSVLLLLSGGSSTSKALGCAAWLLTYLVHTVSWAALAGLIVHFRAPQASRASTLWRLALFGPIATSLASIILPAMRTWLRTVATSADTSSGVMGLQNVSTDLTVAWQAADGWMPSALAALVIGTASVGLLRFVVAAARLRRTLRGRTVVRDARLRARLACVMRRTHLTGVVLTESARVTVPLVVGRREICIPQDNLEAFSDDEVDAVFAHELAHLERGDGVWFPVFGLIESVLWVQPLNRWVGARCRQAAELASDDRAVALTHAPTQLARAIVRVAEQSQRAWTRPLSPGMASVGLSAQRVRRLLSFDRLQTSDDPATRVRHASRWPLACLALLGIASPSIQLERAAMLLPTGAPAAAASSGDSVAYETPEAHRHRLQRELDQLMHHASAGAQSPLTIAELRRALRQLRADDAPVAARFDLPEDSVRLR